MKPVPFKTTLRDWAINFAWMCVIAVVMMALAQAFVKAWDYDCDHPYQTPTLHHSQENQ